MLVVDDHTSFAETLSIAIAAQDDLVSVGIASNVDAGLHMAAATSPDVVLLDQNLPGAQGVGAIGAFRNAAPGVRVIVLTGQVDLTLLTEAARRGAAGFVLKSASLAEVLAAARGDERSVFVDAETLRAVIDAVAPDPDAVPRDGAHLTPREAEVLALLGEATEPKAIARLLGISLYTTRGHIQTILEKLGAHSQLEAVIAASRQGLLRASTDRAGQPPTPAPPGAGLTAE
ncbi:MAG TPA: response regulator transcription factor [Acidimicrobiales bacterium]|nr:response regulator transcription factor [Acidimicrobiales bacterium]